MGGRRRWWDRGGELVLVGILASGVAACAHRGVDLAGGLRTRELMVPVVGVAPAEVPDTYAAVRGGGRRRHEALDIPAPRGTPVVSADAGRILKLRRNHLGGLTIYATDPDERFVYYYAHLAAYRGGLRPGDLIRKGDVIGFVGTTGNADRRQPHLHFQVMVRAAGGRWWGGEPIDPRPFLVTSGRSR